MRTLMALAFLTFSMTGIAQTEKPLIPSPDIQIKTAVLAAPSNLKEGAIIYGYDQTGKFVVLREGKNHLVCLADDPNKEGVQVSCYNNKLEPFMARGRELTSEGKNEAEKREIRKKEAEAGSLKLTDEPGMVYIYSGTDENYDRSTGELKDGKFRYVIYIPYATAESTGLPLKPEVPGMPWLMDPGTHRAHIMITPENK